MARLHLNFVYGVFSQNILASETTWRSTQFTPLPTITAPDTLTLICDPTLRHGLPEIVYITAHTLGSDTVTVLRGRESTTAKNFSSGTDFVHQITAAEITELAAGTGGSSPILYTHTQDVASSLWTINHGLGTFPSVTVVDTLQRVVSAGVTYVDENVVTVESTAPSTGQAFLR